MAGAETAGVKIAAAAQVAERRRTILVVDDIEENRRLARRFLEPTYHVLEAGDGDLALALIDSAPVDLVLLDIRLPGKSGIEVCKEVKAKARVPFLPVLLVTGLDNQDERNAGLEAGADEFLAKPIDRRELLLRLRVFLRLREQEEKLLEMQALEDDLLSLIVHDLRNPLAGILGFIEIARAELGHPDHAAVRADLDHAREAASRLSSALEDLLKVRLFESGAPGLQRTPVAIGALLEDAVATLAWTAKAKGATIELRADGAGSVDVDPRHVRRALESLLENALKYTQRGSAVTISARPRDAGVEVEIADRGVAVPEANKASFFSKFGSVDTRTRNDPRRGGLGLYLARLIAEAHGGSVSVHDRGPDERGALLRMYLPSRAGKSSAG